VSKVGSSNRNIQKIGKAAKEKIGFQMIGGDEVGRWAGSWYLELCHQAVGSSLFSPCFREEKTAAKRQKETHDEILSAAIAETKRLRGEMKRKDEGREPTGQKRKRLRGETKRKDEGREPIGQKRRSRRNQKGRIDIVRPSRHGEPYTIWVPKTSGVGGEGIGIELSSSCELLLLVKVPASANL
jgi:hypothetical protein